MSNTEYTGAKVFKVFSRQFEYRGNYSIVHIDFDHPDSIEKIKEISNYQLDSPDETAPFVEHLRFFLQLVAYDAAHIERCSNGCDNIRDKFEGMEGYYPLDGRHGITVIHTEVPLMSLGAFDIAEIQDELELEIWKEELEYWSD